jgi:hypothetical protein
LAIFGSGGVYTSMQLSSIARSRILTFAVTGLGVVLVAMAGLGQESPIRQVTIDSGWGGLGAPANSSLVLKGRDGILYAGDQPIDPGKIKALLASIQAPTIPAATAGNLGIDRAWLLKNVREVPTQGESARFYSAARNQQALYDQNYRDLGVIGQILPSLFRFVRFDDHPSVKVTIQFADGHSWVVTSESYYPFMLPWTVSQQGRQRSTYNADISRAVALLMSSETPNRERLTERELKIELSKAVMQHIQNQWNTLGVENRAPDGFAKLKQQYQIDRAVINAYRGEDFGYTDDKGPHEENLQMTLRRVSLPPNVADDIVLPYHDGVIEGVDDLATRLSQYETLVLSVPWLSQYLERNPQQPVYIRLVGDRSFSRKAMQVFAADMKALEKDSLATEVAAVQSQVVLVFLGYGSDWIVLPDKRVILWRHSTPASFLKWSASDFLPRRCADYNESGGGCIGALISPDGVIQP